MKSLKINLLGASVALAMGALSAPAMANGSDMVNPQAGVVVGYWHNWCAGGGYKGGIAPCVTLEEVDPQYNVVDVSFMKVYGAVGTIPTFKLDPAVGLSEAQFIEQISELNRQGRSVLIALGGADAHIELRNGQEQALADEIIRLVEIYGFDGLDIDLEQAAVTAADNQTVIPAALRIVKDYYREQGKNFLITMAPEFPYLTTGGKYVPYITALEGYYDWINPQFYNQGGDGIYIEGLGWIAQNNDNLKQEFIYHIADALANGNNGFTKIPHDKLVFGIPTNIDAAATGYVKDPQKLYAAFEQLKAQGQPLRGVMTWSVNWDMGQNSAGQAYNESFIKAYGPFIHGQDILPPEPDNGKPIFNGISNTRVKLGGEFNSLAGVTANDMEDGDLTSSIEVEGNVNTDALGLYALTYRVSDSDDNLTEQVRSVEVYNTKPEIKGVTNASVFVGSEFYPMAGVSALDAEDGDLTDHIVIEGDVDTDTLGQYSLTYRVTDSAGQQTIALRTVTVKEQGAVCENAWDKAKVYLGGETVSYSGQSWLAGWWTQGDEPGTTGEWGVWKSQGDSDCDGGLPPVVKPTLDVTGIAPRYVLEQGSVTIEFSASVNQTMVIKASLVQGNNVFASTEVNSASTSAMTLSATDLVAGSYEVVVSAPEQELTRRTSVSLVEEDEGGDYPAYAAGTQYQAGDVVTNAGGVYECLPWPNSGWCSGSASHYAPGVGSAWADAWFAR
ncbi:MULTISPECIES: immunoglobulin-like domain-containing protein [unclassified Shewanella]|uniref:immunoglobulin-like domain-containing protein n=1 Tax=unclassified Shewanella TaxID=196818 RepID=UPI001BC0D736|nr:MULTISPECIES: immunoglobulin-like domain-containing protein [unclassified Shewanella]GIU19838.1 chitinase ChiA [Shewanella sp. MBTL60-112-B1]GIU27897.1 chitinase ChiA [Shewanella sp. MBTL60-112-B2]